MKKLMSALALSALAFSAQAASVTYSDFDAWSDDVVGVFKVETFNGYDFSGETGHYLGNSVTLDGVTYSSASSVIYGVSKALNYDAGYQSSNYLEWQEGFPNALTISLGGNTNAFSLKIGQFYGTASNYSVVLSNGDSFTVNGGSAYTFFGAISSTAFSSITITGDTFPGIDNVGYGPVVAVPEPETYAMLLGGLALMGALARRRSGKSA